MDQIDRYVLGLAVLEGDRDARKILADLLEEQGERGLAQWARKCGNKNHQRLDFAIMLLPHREALRLATDFAMGTSRYFAQWPMELIQYATTNIRQWLDDLVDDAIFQREVPARLEEMMGRTDNHFFRHARQICDELLTATQHAIHAAHWRRSEDGRLSHYWESMTNQAVRCVTRLSSGGDLTMPGQMKRAIQAFGQLVSPERNSFE